MDYRRTNAPQNTETRDVMKLAEPVGNVYEMVRIISKRANQLSVEMKQDLDTKLQEFASYTDNLEEVFENHEQIEISRFYEKLPKPSLIALQDWKEGEIYYRNPAKEQNGMLQRIQTLFLLLASVCMLVATVTPLASFFYNGDPVVFEAMGMYRSGDLESSTWALFAIGAISALLPIVTVFLYKTRILQIRISIFNIFLMVGFYLYFGFLIFNINPEAGLQFQKIGIGAIMPVIAIILTYLAIRRIGADEILVRSFHRLRK